MSPDQKKNNKFQYIYGKFLVHLGALLSIVSKACGWWFSLVLAYFGDEWSLVEIEEGTKKLTGRGFVFTIAVVVISVLIIFVQQREKKKSIKKVSGYSVLSSILDESDNLCSKKAFNQIKKIAEIKKGKCEPLGVYTKPCEQLNDILQATNRSLVKLLKGNGVVLEENDIYVSLAYKLELETDHNWSWAENVAERGAKIQQLLDRSQGIKSTFLTLLDSNETHLFFNSKQKAYEEGCYIPDNLDKRDSQNHHLLGSIACFKSQIKYDDNVYITYIISVSTYDKKFCNSQNESELKNVELNMKDYIMNSFKKRVEVELCNYYMYYLCDSKRQHINSESLEKSDKEESKTEKSNKKSRKAKKKEMRKNMSKIFDTIK